MSPTVELFSATDPPYVRNRGVWYYTEFDGTRSERLNDYPSVLARAQVLCQEHGARLVDRSDRGSGVLLATLRSY